MHVEIQFIFSTAIHLQILCFPLEIVASLDTNILLNLKYTNNRENYIVSFSEVPCVAQSHFCITKHLCNLMTFAAVCIENKTSPSSVPRSDCAAVAMGTAGTLANVLHLLYRHALSLFSSLRRQLKSP